MKTLNKKFSAILGVIAVSLLLTACHQGGGTSGKVGVIDMQQLLQSPAIQSMEQQLMKQSAPEQAKLKQAYQDVMSLRTKADKATGAEKTTLQAQLKKEETSFSTMMQNAQQQQMKQEHDLQEKINSAISKVADNEDLRYVYVKQVILFGDAEDVTDKVLQQLN